MNKSWKMRIPLFLVILGLAAFSACSAGYSHHHHNDRYGYDNPYATGYERGFDHGAADRRARMNFDFEHDELFRRGISSNPYVNDRFRDGYARGYRDAYYGRRY